MQQTFRKNVGRKDLQFNRLLYPVRYTVKVDEDGGNGYAIEFKKDDDGEWKPIIPSECEQWFEENAVEIGSIIEENEVQYS